MTIPLAQSFRLIGLGYISYNAVTTSLYCSCLFPISCTETDLYDLGHTYLYSSLRPLSTTSSGLITSGRNK